MIELSKVERNNTLKMLRLLSTF